MLLISEVVLNWVLLLFDEVWLIKFIIVGVVLIENLVVILCFLLLIILIGVEFV